MSVGSLKKLKTVACMGSAAGFILVVWLVCFVTAKSNSAAGFVLPDTGENIPEDNASVRDVDPEADANPVADFGREDDSGYCAGAEPGRVENELVVCEYGAETDGELEESALKEEMIRERFGVIFRRGRWIPTVNGGTNLVYITNGSLPWGRVGEAYYVQFNAVSGFPPYKWEVVGNDLPFFFALDADSGRLAGIPLEPVTTNFFVEVTDSRGAKDMAEYVLVFQPEETLDIMTETLPSALPGQEYLFQLEASGGVPPYFWSAAGDLDEIGALTLDHESGLLYGEIFESAPEADVPLVFWVSDSQLNVSKALTLRIRERLGILDIAPVSLLQSEAFEISFHAAGGVEPYVWGVTGMLPSGLVVSSEGVCSGTPSEPGVYDAGVWVQDGAGNVDVAQFTLEVRPVPVDEVSGFEALLSRNSVALSWNMPDMDDNLSVRIVRTSEAGASDPEDGTTVYHGAGNSVLDRDIGAGIHYYTAFLEKSGLIETSAPPRVLRAQLPPDADPFADRVVSADLLHPNAFRSADLPNIVLGPPKGGGLSRGSLNVVSLGAATNDDDGASAPYGGSITLEFVDNLVWNGPGVDFTVFENVFYITGDDGQPDPEARFMEPAVVSVSQDGIHWHQFKFDFSPRFHPDTGRLNLRHPYCYNKGFAGVNPVMSHGYDPDPTDPEVSGGDSFDLSDVGLDWIRYVRIQSTGHLWLYDESGDLVHHTEDFGSASRHVNTSGFDLDAVAAIWMKKVESQ